MRPRRRLAFFSAAVLAALAAILTLILPSGTAPAASPAAAENRVWAFSLAAQVHVRADRLVSAGERLGEPPACPFYAPGACAAPEAGQAATLETAVNAKAAEVIASQSIRVRGPVLSGAMDTQTGDIFYGQNTGIPDPLHPDLQQLLDGFPGPGAAGKGIPGSHAEINALNQGLFARPGSQISDFIFYNVRLRGAAQGSYIAPCPNCAWFLGG
ncbi:MAG TPA: YwqJ-related putative deaminase [Streptosporangiaceae bacterium]|nr:YwqJ-related putative deaminase [Streptosporangiaceae bacterium]